MPAEIPPSASILSQHLHGAGDLAALVLHVFFFLHMPVYRYPATFVESKVHNTVQDRTAHAI